MLIKPNFPKKILLGSKSPRRSYLMKESGFEVIVKTIDVDESYPAKLETEKIAEFIALKKAHAYRSLLADDMVGIVADTIVSLEGEILEKPTDRQNAHEMLSKLSSRKHQVLTGVCIFDQEKSVQFIGISDVYFLDLSPLEINYYLDHYKPYDKAGSYGIQEWIGYTKIEKIIGSYSNIMGLPMEKVYAELFNFID